jgi:nucleobase:cation symporter-1, NCS1 family
MTATPDGQIIHEDGRHELSPAAHAGLNHALLHNEDLAPVPMSKRNWTTYNYLTLWVGMSINIPTWFLASGLVAVGMAWYQAILIIALANVIVLVPMLLISHAGTKYGIPYPVVARAAFGVFGANLPALIRAGVACGWFGIQTWIGGTAIFVLMASVFGANSWWATAGAISIGIGDAASQPWTMWLSFLIFWSINILIIVRGMDAIKRFEGWAAPLLIVVFLGLMVVMVFQAGGLGPVVENPGTLGWGPDFWAIVPISLMGMIAFWSTLSLNMPDFTRFGRSQREQARGQAIGLPVTMTLFPLIGVLTTSAAILVFTGAPAASLWDPVFLVSQITNPIIVILMLFTLSVATLSTNVAANVVSPSYDFSNVWPSKVSFRTGGIITGVIGILIMPWNLLATPELYIFTWLGTYGGVTGAIAGVIIADYWLIRKTELRLADLYKPSGVYQYARGWNWRGVVALAVGAFLALGGAHSAPGSGPFPADGFIPLLRPVYDYSWVASLLIAFGLYLALTRLSPRKIEGPQAAPQAA